MIYQDSINFVEDSEFQVYPFGTAEDYMAIQAMSSHGKDENFVIFGAEYNNHYGVQNLPTSYESPLANQNDLAALPNGYGSEYDESYGYDTTQAEDYAQVSMPATTDRAYSLIPPAATAQPSYEVLPKSKKRKASVESFHVEAPAPKRIAIHDPSGEYYDLKSEPSPYSSMVPTPTTLSASQLTYQLTGSPRVHGHQHSTSNVSQMSLPAVAPYTPTVSPSFTTANTEHSPRAPATPGARPASVASNPKLVRTSTIPQHSPQAPQPTLNVVGHTQNFNPYTLFSPDSKARLHLEGDLDGVAKEWKDEELESRRKIVVFEREQKGNDINATFSIVAQNEWKSHPRSVSCIWWAEKKEAYVTSVDTILLLEGIVGARFTVEEKNRIRRNLEGFKPETVSKAKPETEEFFKVIMGFPNPKPRNIEKDVKVFPWRVLSVALHKIISKYSASYATTASSISQQPKVYRSMDHHEFGYSTSPAPEYHHGSLQMASFPIYETQGRMSAPVTPSIHFSPQLAHGPDGRPYGYPQVQMPPLGQGHYPGQAMNVPMTTGGQYWQHHHGYVTEGGMHMGPASAPATAYPREMIETAEFHRAVPMGHYIHSGQR